MSTNTIVRILCLCVIVTMSSCDTTMLVELPENPPKLTLNFVGSSDYPWKGRVAVSNGVLKYDDHLEPDEIHRLIEGTKIRIFEEGKEVEPINESIPSSSQYDGVLFNAASFTPMPGKTYKIEAESEKYGQASATYIHPLPVNIEGLKIEKIVENDSEKVQVTITFNDPVEKNYYGVILNRLSPTWPGSGSSTKMYPVDPAYDKGPAFMTYFTDDLFNGSKTSMVFTSSFSKDYFSGTEANSKFEIHFRTFSKEYYEYERTKNLQSQTIGDPYAQPVMVENNINNGFGIFGGFNESVKTGKFE